MEDALNESNNRTQFMDLNMDVQLLVLEHLNFRDLYSTAVTNKQLSKLAGQAFRTKLSKKIVVFMNPFMHYVQKDLTETDDYIYIQRLETMLRILKNFGRSISKLSTHHSIGEQLSKEQLDLVKTINGLISSNCADTLVHFETCNSQENVFDGITKPFKNVENVTLHGQFKTLRNANFTFDELFPAVRRLSLPSIEYCNLSSVGLNLPKLEHLEVHIHPYQPLRFTESDIQRILTANPEVIEMLQRNPQIRSLKLGCSSRRFLQKINEMLPNLESLELIYFQESFSQNENEILFKNVKIFTIFTMFGDPKCIPTNIHFEKFVELHTNVSPMEYNWWIDFIKNNKDLKKLHLDQGCADTRILDAITAMELNLVEISLTVDLHVGYENIVKFVKANKQVEIFRFLHHDPTIILGVLARIFNEEVSKEWTITELNHEVRLERKAIQPILL